MNVARKLSSRPAVAAILLTVVVSVATASCSSLHSTAVDQHAETSRARTTAAPFVRPACGELATPA